MIKFLLLFIVLTISEVYLMKLVAEKFGLMLLIGIVLFTGFLGLALAKKQGRAHLLAIQNELLLGKIPANPITEGLLILVAAAVLITPGFITDFLGFLLLIPMVRRFLAPRIARLFKPKVMTSNSTFFHFSSTGSSYPDEKKNGAGYFDMPEESERKDKKNLEG